ncbi:hypothetical protein [Wolbachia endosymbiont of Pentidionis agamae]|uniref:hypothetical protein n=1 Tax=Wolbachia endosymbiont of Pentidionis agamae TaxID=3110435 RepID=UPI002FD0DF51
MKKTKNFIPNKEEEFNYIDSSPPLDFGSGVVRVLKLPLRAILYVINPLNWFNSAEKIGRDFRAAISANTDIVPTTKLYASVLETEKHLGVEVAGIKPGAVALSFRRSLIGELDKLTQEKIEEIESNYRDVKLSADHDSITVQFDTEKIQDRNRDQDKTRTKRKTIGEICSKVDSVLNEILNVTLGKGWFGKNSNIINNNSKRQIATILYRSYNYTRCDESWFRNTGDTILVSFTNSSKVKKQTKGSNRIAASYTYDSDLGKGCIVVRGPHLRGYYDNNSNQDCAPLPHDVVYRLPSGCYISDIKDIGNGIISYNFIREKDKIRGSIKIRDNSFFPDILPDGSITAGFRISNMEDCGDRIKCGFIREEDGKQGVIEINKSNAVPKFSPNEAMPSGYKFCHMQEKDNDTIRYFFLEQKNKSIGCVEIRKADQSQEFLKNLKPKREIVSTVLNNPTIVAMDKYNVYKKLDNSHDRAVIWWE